MVTRMARPCKKMPAFNRIIFTASRAENLSMKDIAMFISQSEVRDYARPIMRSKKTTPKNSPFKNPVKALLKKGEPVIGIVIHYVFRALIWHDHNRFRVLLAAIETRGRMRNGMVWGGSSVTPLPLGRSHTEKDFRHV